MCGSYQYSLYMLKNSVLVGALVANAVPEHLHPACLPVAKLQLYAMQAGLLFVVMPMQRNHCFLSLAQPHTMGRRVDTILMYYAFSLVKMELSCP